MQPVTPETCSLAQFLEFVDRFLARDTRMSQMGWDILTALRGPDREGDCAKNATIDIRIRALPRCHARRAHWGIVNGALFVICGDVPATMENYVYGAHFATHIDNARKALDYLANQKEKETKS